MNTTLNDLTSFDPKKGRIAFGQSNLGKSFNDIEQIKKDFSSALRYVKIKNIAVSTGVRIHRLSVTYTVFTDNGTFDKTYTHGGRDGREHFVNFSDSDELQEVLVMVGSEIESVKFLIFNNNTKKVKYTERYGGGGGTERYYDMGLPIIGFYGTTDGYRITSLGLYCHKSNDSGSPSKRYDNLLNFHCFGNIGGNFHSDKLHIRNSVGIAKIIIGYSNQHVHTLQAYYRTEIGDVITGTKFGVKHSDTKEETIYFKPGERIKSICIKGYKRISSIMFTIADAKGSQKETVRFGGEDGTNYNINEKSGYEILGFCGRFDSWFDAIGVVSNPPSFAKQGKIPETKVSLLAGLYPVETGGPVSWFANHAFVFESEKKHNFNCMGGVEHGNVSYAVHKADLELAITLSCLNPYDRRHYYNRWYDFGKPTGDNDNWGMLRWGDCCGIDHAFHAFSGGNGVCHQIANRVLLCVGIDKAMPKAISSDLTTSYTIYGMHGRDSCPICDNPDISLNWLDYLAYCKVLVNYARRGENFSINWDISNKVKETKAQLLSNLEESNDTDYKELMRLEINHVDDERALPFLRYELFATRGYIESVSAENIAIISTQVGKYLKAKSGAANSEESVLDDEFATLKSTFMDILGEQAYNEHFSFPKNEREAFDNQNDN